MKTSLRLVALALLIFSCGSSNKSSSNAIAADPVKYASTITSDELTEMLYTYASDDFEGRETGEAGQKKAINYLKEHYVNMGISSALSEEDYFQEVPIIKQRAPKVEITVNDKAPDNYLDYIVMGSVDTQVLNTSEIVYAGYGIDSEAYSDYRDLDVKGKVVLVKAGEPTDDNGNFVTTGFSEKTKWSSGRSSISAKRDAAQNRGAKALLFYNPDMLLRYGPYYKQLAESGTYGRMSLKTKGSSTIFIMIGEIMGNAIHPEIETSYQSKTIQTNLTANITSTSAKVDTENVVAYIKGSEKPDEYLVISAHLDHIGMNDDGAINNGADDDGSGTVAVLEIAEAFKTAINDGYAPKRSVVFLHVTGEEKGLLGSRHYTDNDPIFPLEQTVANLNIDMIGRVDANHENDRNYVYVIGSDKLSSDLHKISEDINARYTNINLDYKYNDDNDPNRYYYRSDHYNFAKHNVPVIFYFNGTHEDYHQPGDTPDKIEYDLLENRTRLVFHTAWELANRAERPVVDKIEFE